MSLLYFLLQGPEQEAEYVGERQQAIEYEDSVTWFCSLMRYSNFELRDPVVMMETDGSMTTGRRVAWGWEPDAYELSNELREKLKGVKP